MPGSENILVPQRAHAPARQESSADAVPRTEGTGFDELIGRLTAAVNPAEADLLDNNCEMGVGIPTTRCQDPGGLADNHLEGGPLEPAEAALGGSAQGGPSPDREYRFRRKRPRNGGGSITLIDGQVVQSAGISSRVWLRKFNSSGPLNKLVRVLRDRSSAGKSGVVLTLNLPGIGEIKFNVRTVKGKIVIHARVADQKTAALLAQGEAELTAYFASNGLTLGRFTVGYDDPGAGDPVADRSAEGKRHREGNDPLPAGSLGAIPGEEQHRVDVVA